VIRLRPTLFLAWLVLPCVPMMAYSLCYAAKIPPAFLDPANEPAEKLGDYHFFLDTKKQIPNVRVVPFDLNTPHFADYAHLRRFLWLPQGTSITYHDRAELEYPIGAVLIISVGYFHDFRHPDLGEDLIETRLFVRRKQGWQGVQYTWNEETTEASYSVMGTRAEASWVHYDGSNRSHTVLAPNSNQCKQCHEIDGKMVPLGPTKADRINREFLYPEGPENQLARWSKIGYLTGAPKNPDDAPRMPVWNDPSTGSVHERARAYLEMNCASCHRPQGLAYTSGLDLTFAQQSPVRYGVFKSPVAAGRGVGNGRFAIEPGSPGRSFLLHRLRSIDPGVRMPIVGRGLIHEEGVALIEQWIAEMQFATMAKAQSQADRQGIHRTVPSEKSSEDDSRPILLESHESESQE